VVLELFAYTSSADDPDSRAQIGGNLDEIGVKHFALKVDSIEDARRDLIARKLAPEDVAITDGRTGLRYLFLRDPDGIWVEIVQDDR
jgi:glyoxylase I family protein